MMQGGALLSDEELEGLISFRRELHQAPELSGAEAETADRVRKRLSATGPDEIVSGLGGHGIAVVYNGSEPGPTVLVRAELDALPIEEISCLPYRSSMSGKGHLCGHDGHIAILSALGLQIARQRPRRGRVVLLFQPAEETGAGAAAVIADPRFASLMPDYAFALHNLPGLPLGKVWMKEGAASCASVGVKIVLTGKTAHASMPETGISPGRSLARLIPELSTLSSGEHIARDFAMVTVTHAVMGEPAFGIAPAKGEIWATLRTLTDERMNDLHLRVAELVSRTADAERLTYGISLHESFAASTNHPEAVSCIRHALNSLGLPHEEGKPMRASEDFGQFGTVSKMVLFFLGAGETHPQLHNPDYDFPDELIPIGASIFHEAIGQLLGWTVNAGTAVPASIVEA